MKRELPSTAATLATIARVTLRRLRGGVAAWVALGLACLPAAFAAALRGHGDLFDALVVIELLLLAVLPPLFVASSVGEDIEDRTTAYLWSRPLARWTVLAGKLVALAPIAMALAAGSWVLAMEVGTHAAPSAASTLGLAGAALAIALISAGIAVLVPRHGLALAILYILFIDLPLGEIPASLQKLSVTHQARLIADGSSPLSPALTMAAIAAVWFAIGLWRVRKLEA